MDHLTLPSRPSAGPMAVSVRPGPKSGPGERHVVIGLTPKGGSEQIVTARFRDVPSREGVIALATARDDRSIVTDLAELALIEAHTLATRIDGKPAEICIAAGPLRRAVLAAQSFEPRPEQGAMVVPPAAEEPKPKPKRRKEASE